MKMTFDLDSFLKMYRHAQQGAFAASDQGQKAFADFFAVYDDFIKAFDRDTARQKAESLRLQGALRQNNKRYSKAPLRRPVLASFDRRKFRATRESEVWRALSVGEDRASRFAWRVNIICEDGLIDLGPPWNGDRDWTPEVEKYFADQARERQAQQAGAHIAHKAQKLFKARNVPMNFSVGVGLLYYELAGDYVNDVEKPYVHGLIANAAEGHGYAFVPQDDRHENNGTFLQYGLLVGGFK